MRNLYKVLGIASSADDSRIKSAFRNRAKAVHPDLNPGSEWAEEQFRELMQAYQVLRDAHTRAAYDAHLAQRRRDARRRFAHSAAVMALTFVLTTGSAAFVLGLQGINVHSETWQLATGWLTSVEIEAPMSVSAPTGGPSAGTSGSTTIARAAPGTAPGDRRYAVTEVRPTKASANAAPPARSGMAEPGVTAPSKAGGVAEPQRAPEADAPASQRSWWPWPDAEQPYFGLGATNRN